MSLAFFVGSAGLNSNAEAGTFLHGASACRAPGAGILGALPAPASENPSSHQTASAATPIAPLTGRSVGAVALFAAAVLAALWAWRKRLYQPIPPRPPGEPPLGTIADWPFLLLGGLLIWVAQMLGASSASSLLSLTPEETKMVRGSAILSLGAYTGAAAGAVFVFLALPGMARLVRALPEWREHLPAAARAALAFILVFPIVMALGTAASLILTRLHLGPTEPIAHRTLRMLAESGAASGDNALWWGVNIAAVVVAAPIVEELIYRGFIQSAIRRALLWRAAGSAGSGITARGRRRITWAAILLASAVFTLMHAGVAEPHALLTLFALSLCFGIAYERTGSLAAPIVMHVLFNAVNVGLAMV